MTTKKKQPQKKVNLYELLKVEQTATSQELRKAYLAMARVTHPDKFPAEARAEATVAFQALKKAFDVLNDPVQRDRYDRTGVLPEDESDSFSMAYERFRGIKVTKEDIEATESAYRSVFFFFFW